MVSGGYTLAYPGSVPGLAAALRRAMFSLGRCLLRVISRHDIVELRCPLFPRKRTLSGNLCTSALGQKLTFGRHRCLKRGYIAYLAWACAIWPTSLAQSISIAA